jgi:hypothetical protein
VANRSKIRNEAGLTPPEDNFARLMALGVSLAEAYRKSFRARGINQEVIQGRAWRLSQKEYVIERAKAYLKAARISDLDSAGQYYRDLTDFINKSAEKHNYTAVAAFMRLRGQVLGILQENVHLHAEAGLTDEQIVAKLAGKDHNKRVMLQTVLGTEKYDAYQKVS